MTHLLTKPIITEKSMKDVDKSKFTFLVDHYATKEMIKRAVQDKFNVTVRSVATTYIKGRSMRAGVRRVEVKLPRLKKAIVTLKAGEKIDLFEAAV